jgi:hypothetical protein
MPVGTAAEAAVAAVAVVAAEAEEGGASHRVISHPFPSTHSQLPTPTLSEKEISRRRESEESEEREDDTGSERRLSMLIHRSSYLAGIMNGLRVWKEHFSKT